ncbi:DKNYY domain-containing protein [Cytophagaceae bacterium ABcell3]|nr:DKNYY domain-containing protein [Cytophagaceae bacterium ABcell3]
MATFTYPVLLFSTLQAFNLRYFGTVPLWWAVSVFFIGVLAILAYRLPWLLHNLTKGISNDGYFIGDQHVYLNGILIKGADPKTFVHYGDTAYYSKDGKNVYGGTIKIPGADPSTFERIESKGSNYWRDKNQAYTRWHVIPGADGATFEYIGEGYARDAKHVYYQKRVLEGADPKIFQTIGDFIGRDHKRVYVMSYPANNIIDLQNFQLVKFNESEELFGKDSSHIYAISYNRENPLLPFPNADLKSFEVLESKYAKDDNQVYYYGHATKEPIILKEANPKTFVVERETVHYTDANDGENYYKDGAFYKK